MDHSDFQKFVTQLHIIDIFPFGLYYETFEVEQVKGFDETCSTFSHISLH